MSKRPKKAVSEAPGTAPVDSPPAEAALAAAPEAGGDLGAGAAPAARKPGRKPGRGATAAPESQAQDRQRQDRQRQDRQTQDRQRQPAPGTAPQESDPRSRDLRERELQYGVREAAVDAALEATAQAVEAAGDVTDDSGAHDPAGPDAAGSPADGEASAEPGAPEAGPSRKRARVQLPPPPPERLVGAVEALLLASGDVLTPERLRDMLGLASAIHVREAIEQVRQRWAAAGLSVELQEVAGGVRVVTRPEYAEYVRRMQRHVSEGKLSQGLLETLSIVAYRQPVARPEIERIRGVQVGEALRALLERRLIKVVGRSDQPGRPMLYGTTTRFLTSFGLNDLKDLPSAKDLARL